MKIIYIFERRHYYTYDDDKFGIDYFRSKGHDVEVWSAVRWTFGLDVEEPKNIHEGKLVYIDDEETLKNELERVRKEKCSFILFPYLQGYTSISLTIRKRIKKYKFDFYNLTESASPSEILDIDPCHKASILGKFFKDIINDSLTWLSFNLGKKKNSISKSKNRRYHVINPMIKIYGPLWYRSKYNFVATRNQYNYFPNKLEIFSKRNILVPHMDYGKYLEMLSESEGKEKYTKYAVFIDEFEIGHSDFKKIGIEYVITNQELYFQELNKFFDQIESQFGLKVVIAAHPKAEYKGNEFNGRKIYYFETFRVVKNAELVLYEYGSSLSYALLYRKNFIHFCTSQHFKGHKVDNYMKKISHLMSSKILKIHEVVGNIEDIYINRYTRVYDEMLERYLVPKVGWDKDMFTMMEEYISSADLAE